MRVRGFIILWLLSVLAAMAQYKLMGQENLLRYVPCFLPGILAYRINKEKPRQISYLWLVAFLIVFPILFVLGDFRGDVWLRDI